MITHEELAGIAEVLVVVMEKEWADIYRELAYLREEEPPASDEIMEAVEEAVCSGLLAALGKRELSCELDGSRFYTVGPGAFPIVPEELSEVIDILRLGTSSRKIDWDMVAQVKVADIISRITALSGRADKLYGQRPSRDKVGEIEQEYSDLLALLSDYEFWLPCDLDGARESLGRLSRKIEALKV